MSVESLKDTKQKIVEPKKMGLLVENPVYKPFRYPWCYDAWLTQQRIHWLPEEVPLGDDVRDWQKNLSESEKNLLTQIFRFFTQADVEVNNCYLRHYTTVFKPTEVLMMMTAFASMETVHVAAYSHLLDTIGMPESEYSAFMKYKEMKDKYDYMQNFNVNSKEDIAKITVFIVEEPEWDKIRSASNEFLPSPRPSMSLIYVKGLFRPEIKVEIEALAAVD